MIKKLSLYLVLVLFALSFVSGANPIISKDVNDLLTVTQGGNPASNVCLADGSVAFTGDINMSSNSINEIKSLILKNVNEEGNNSFSARSKLEIYDTHNFSQLIQMYHHDNKGIITVYGGNLDFESSEGNFVFTSDQNEQLYDSKLFIRNKYNNKSGTLEYSESSNKFFIGTDIGGIDFRANNGIYKFANSGTNNDVYILDSSGSNNLFFRHTGTEAQVRALQGDLYLNSASGNVKIGNLAGSYTGGSAYVCVYNSGQIYASETACP